MIHPERGVVVTAPAAAARPGPPRAHVDRFLRNANVVAPPPRRLMHATVPARRPRRPDRRRHDPLPGRDPSTSPGQARAGLRRSSVERIGGAEEDEIIVHVAPADRRSIGSVLEAWLKPRARTAIEREIGRHAPALGVSPTAVTIRDQRTRWGSASRQSRLASRGDSSSLRPRRSRRSSSTSSPICASSATDRGSGRWSHRAGRITRSGAVGCTTTPRSCTRHSTSRRTAPAQQAHSFTVEFRQERGRSAGAARGHSAQASHSS